MNLLYLSLVTKDKLIPFYRVKKKMWFRMANADPHNRIDMRYFRKLSHTKVVDNTRHMQIDFKTSPELQKVLCSVGKYTLDEFNQAVLESFD